MIVDLSWLKIFAGRNFYAREGHELSFMLIPREDLMGPGEEGMHILAGLFVRISVRSPWGRRDWIRWGETHGWRRFIGFYVRSDAGEITKRNAARA